eukprot:356972_1
MDSVESYQGNTIILIDWDDTLFPATSLIKKHNTYTPNDVETLSELLSKLLNIYLSTFGNSNVFIITNGEQNWVLQSLQIAINYCEQHKIKNQFKTVFELVLSGKIKTISANYLYSNQYPTQTMIWKYFVFKQIVTKRFANNNSKHCVIICIGDSLDEYNASKKVIIDQQLSTSTTLHRLKLIAKPTIDEMNQQFQLIISMVSVFQQHTTSITIDYAKEKAKYS